MEPFIVIQSKKTVKVQPKVKEEAYKSVKKLRDFDNKKKISIPVEKVDINKADSVLLIKIYGVGPVFAHRIINYRNLLGGFVTKSQLLEVFGMRVENYEQIEPFVMVSTDSISKINLNSASFKELVRHPYITYNHTKSLVRYRDIMSQFDSVGVIIANHLMDSVSYYKVQPYLEAN
jgi:DNA uptake protein ComE-like DNA-binding protein